MKTYLNPERIDWAEIMTRPMIEVTKLRKKVKKILEEIRTGGDEALRKYTLQFDKVEITDFVVSESEIAESVTLLDENLKTAIAGAAANISTFHRWQLQSVNKAETMPGVFCWQKQVPIDKIGIYIPGGTAPLFSTVLMLAIPAQIAGCRDVVMCTPPDHDGKIHPAILYAAKLAGVTRIFKLGGIQAIGAMAYGTETVPAVYKIFGPGNQYVMTAKQIVNMNQVTIDMPAGPSEVMVVADAQSHADFVAADLLSQAEHGIDSQVILLSKSYEFIEQVKQQIEIQIMKLPRKEIALKALENCALILMENLSDTVDFINQYAPEHLIISATNYVEIASQVRNAGSVFLGCYTPESAGDYASGTNHTLPTNGWARSFNGVNIDSYIKKITFQEITTTGLQNLAPIIEPLAEAEHLQAHKNAVTIRIDYLNSITPRRKA